MVFCGSVLIGMLMMVSVNNGCVFIVYRFDSVLVVVMWLKLNGLFIIGMKKLVVVMIVW